MHSGTLLSLKIHRFELTAAVILAALAGLAAGYVAYRLGSIAIDEVCGAAYFAGAAVDAECSAAIDTFVKINGEEAGPVFAAFGALPLAVGLLAGVPIVGREIEARTAPIAWALAGSRSRWLLRQVWSVLVVLGVGMAFAATGSSALETARTVLPSSAWSDLGLHGPLVLARTLAAFGAGLLAGAMLGRTLPGLIAGAVLALIVSSGVGVAREAWLATQPLVVMDSPEGAFGGFTYAQGWRAPSGQILTDAQAVEVASAQSSQAYEWLAQQDYEAVQLILTDDSAYTWGTIEGLGLAALGGGCVLATVAVVSRRRPE